MIMGGSSHRARLPFHADGAARSFPQCACKSRETLTHDAPGVHEIGWRGRAGMGHTRCGAGRRSTLRQRQSEPSGHARTAHSIRRRVQAAVLAPRDGTPPAHRIRARRPGGRAGPRYPGALARQPRERGAAPALSGPGVAGAPARAGAMAVRAGSAGVPGLGGPLHGGAYPRPTRGCSTRTCCSTARATRFRRCSPSCSTTAGSGGRRRRRWRSCAHRWGSFWPRTSLPSGTFCSPRGTILRRRCRSAATWCRR